MLGSLVLFYLFIYFNTIVLFSGKRKCTLNSEAQKIDIPLCIEHPLAD